MSSETPPLERRLDRTSLVLVIVLSILTLIFFSPGQALSLALGGVLSTINFHWLKQAVDFIVLRGGSGPVGKRIALQYAARYALIGLVLYVTIRVSFLDPAFVLAGLLIYVFALLLEAVIEIWKNIRY